MVLLVVLALRNLSNLNVVVVADDAHAFFDRVVGRCILFARCSSGLCSFSSGVARLFA